MKALKALAMAAVLAVLAVRGCEVSRSSAGLWAEHPHSGFCPDSPSAE